MDTADSYPPRRSSTLRAVTEECDKDRVVERVKDVVQSKGVSEDRELRRAALNLMEDAVAAREAERIEITERQRAEVELRKSEERLQQALNAAAMGTFIWDIQVNRTEPDRRMLALLGLPSDCLDVLQEDLPRMIHPDDAGGYAAAIAQALNPQGDGRLREDVRIRRADETEHWLAISGEVYFEGEPRAAVRMVGAAIDITERKRTEENLRESERLLRRREAELAQVQLVGGVGGMDIDAAHGLAGRRSPEYQRLHGLPPSVSEEKHEDWLRRLHPEDRTRAEQALIAALEGGQSIYENEYRIIRQSDHEERWIYARANIERSENGQPLRLIGAHIDITERKRAEEARRASEDRLRTLANAVPQIIWTNDERGSANYFNERWSEYTGLTVAQSLGPGWEAVVHPEDAVRSVGEWREASAAGKPFETEYRLRGSDGGYRWFICRTIPQHDSAGRLMSWFGTATDIQDRKTAEATMRETESRNRIALEAAEMATWDYNVGSSQLVWNEQHYRLFAMEPDGKLKSPDDFFRFVHPQDQAMVGAKLKHAVEETGVYKAEFRVIRADGVVRWMSGYGRAIENSGGRVKRMMGVMFDVTERHEADEALIQSQERLRLIVENAREYAIFSADLDRRVTSWNAGAERLLGYTEKEIVGQVADIIFTDEDRAAGMPAEEATRALSEGRASDERWHVGKDGRRFWGSGAMMAMHDAAGATIGLVKIFRDQTQEMQARKAMEQSQSNLWQALRENEQAREAAEMARKAKDHFLAVLSHELRTPLTPVLMATQTLARQNDLPPMTREALEMIDRNIRSEIRLIDDLLDVTRIERGKMELQSEPLRLHDVLRHTLEVTSSDMEAKNQILVVNLEALCDALYGDLLRLQQVFWNLLKNASKFTPDGGMISVNSWNEGEQIVVAITDSGIGLDPAASGHIFEPFTQADVSVTREFGGLGLGLAIAKVIVEAHQGTLGVASEGRAKGATFTTKLPLNQEPEENVG